MKKLSKLVLREHILPADLVGKKAQKYIMGGVLHYTCFECYCSGGGGFCTCVDDTQTLVDRLDSICSGGGSCTQVGGSCSGGY